MFPISRELYHGNLIIKSLNMEIHNPGITTSRSGNHDKWAIAALSHEM